jgi:hypothetical protein
MELAWNKLSYIEIYVLKRNTFKFEFSALSNDGRSSKGRGQIKLVKIQLLTILPRQKQWPSQAEFMKKTPPLPDSRETRLNSRRRQRNTYLKSFQEWDDTTQQSFAAKQEERQRNNQPTKEEKGVRRNYAWKGKSLLRQNALCIISGES